MAPKTKDLPHFRQCPGCAYNFVTGHGRRACNWYDCPYLSEEYKVLCPQCNHNFATGEGTPRCGDPPSCDWAERGYEHARNILELRARRR